MANNYLLIMDSGDYHKQIPTQYWSIPCPIGIDTKPHLRSEYLDFFKESMVVIYECFCVGSCTAMYFFEIEQAGKK